MKLNIKATILLSAICLNSWAENKCFDVYERPIVPVKISLDSEAQSNTQVQTIVNLLRGNANAGYSAARFVTSHLKGKLEQASVYIQESSFSSDSPTGIFVQTFSEQRDQFSKLLRDAIEVSKPKLFSWRANGKENQLADNLISINSLLASSQAALPKKIEMLEEATTRGEEIRNFLQNEMNVLGKTIDKLVNQGSGLMSNENARTGLFNYVVPHLLSVHENLETSISLLNSHINTLNANLGVLNTIEMDLNTTRFNMIPVLALSNNKKLKELVENFNLGKKDRPVCISKESCFDRELKTGEVVYVFNMLSGGEAFEGIVEGIFQDRSYSVKLNENASVHKLSRNNIGIADRDLKIDDLSVGDTGRYTNGTLITVVAFIPNQKKVIVRNMENYRYYVVKRSKVTKNQ
jgi:hypothetical protein